MSDKMLCYDRDHGCTATENLAMVLITRRKMVDPHRRLNSPTTPILRMPPPSMPFWMAARSRWFEPRYAVPAARGHVGVGELVGSVV